ncbi:hypothetical protein HPB50_004200 [Hyalomma asiaticum]|uniref:Uncharacterized protein n=1 Tax=Hyalomma asiaticum TaxID=266040 RepID=A0ACB7SVK9_HYAAI|nr:hypothetical protein HPB50_004200 [Hyalomma asiaticum]
MAARSKSVEASPDAGPAPGLTPSRGSGAPLRMLKRTVMLETVSKSVTERKESTKQVTDQATGVERRRDSHIDKRQEETVESYDSTPLPAASQPTLGTQPQAATVAGGGVSVPDVSVDASRKTSPKHPVAIRVQDDHADEDIASSSAPTMSEAPARPAVPLTSHGSTTSILRAPSHEDVENRKSTGHKLEFQEEDRSTIAAASSDQGEDDDEVAEPPPSRFNMRRKDSIAVTKLRMLRQQEEGSEEEPADEDEAPDPGATSPEKKHPVFRPPTVISIVPEEEVSMASEAVDSAEGKGPPPAADDCKAADDKPQTITESSTHVDKQVTSTEKQEVQTFPNETVTRVNADEVVKQTKSEVITETTTMMPREASAASHCRDRRRRRVVHREDPHGRPLQALSLMQRVPRLGDSFFVDESTLESLRRQGACFFALSAAARF